MVVSVQKCVYKKAYKVLFGAGVMKYEVKKERNQSTLDEKTLKAFIGVDNGC